MDAGGSCALVIAVVLAVVVVIAVAVVVVVVAVVMALVVENWDFVLDVVHRPVGRPVLVIGGVVAVHLDCAFVGASVGIALQSTRERHFWL